MKRRWLVWAGSSMALALVFACNLDYTVDDAKFCQLAPEDSYCASLGGAGGVSGAGGLGGLGGASGAPMQGTGGAPSMGTGGGGTGGMGGTAGQGPCTTDDACVTDRGAGSLCLGGACTKATGACEANVLVVVADGRTVDDAALADACYVRSLDDAREAITGTTTRLALYTDAASSTAVLAFTVAATLDGHHSDPAQLVALTLPTAADTALVTLPAGGAVKGVLVRGGAQTKGIVAGAGALALAGPLRLEAALVGLELGDGANATVSGTLAAPITFATNTLGVQVGATAALTMTSDVAEGGLVLEGSGTSTGVRVLDGGSSNTVRLEKARVTGHAVGVEVQQGRAVTLQGNVFVQDNNAIVLNAEDTQLTNLFLGVSLEGNDFTQSRPAVDRGVALCGSRLGLNDTTLRLGQGNLFPSTQACGALDKRDSCNTGGDVGFDVPGNALDVVCL